MNIVILGAGNIAHFLLQQLSASGTARVVQLYNHREDSAAALCRQYHVPLVTDLEQLNRTADIYVFCVKDHAIADLATRVHLKDYQTAVHCAGSQPIDLLLQSGEHHAVVWPLYSINKQGLPQHRNVPLIVEASSGYATEEALAFARLLSDNIHPATYAQRQYLHLNAVIVNNFTNHLLAIGAKICAEQSLSFELLKPIIQQTITQAMQHDPSTIQTGPAIRKDQSTQNKHLELLSAHPEWAAVYQALSASIEKMYS